MQERDAEDLVAEVADGGGNIKLSLQRVLSGFMDEVGGAENWGRELARMVQDPEVNITSRVSLANNMTKMLGSYGGSNDDDLDGMTAEQLEAALKIARD